MTTIDPSKISTCSLESMQMHIGDRLQVELLTDSTRSHHYTTLIGYVPGHSLLMRTPQVQNLPIPVREGEPVLVRTFSGRHAYTFESTVDRVCRAPYPYLHLAYPSQVQQTLIRGALRVRVNLPATALNAAKQGEALPSASTIADLSISGALLEAEKSLGEVGETLELAFKFLVQPNNYEVKLATQMQIQSVRKTSRERRLEDLFTHGVRFAKLRPTEALLLQSYIQQVLLDDRSRVV
ncbi:MAG: flagellar brake protein [Betaproteobacteria bacterium]